MATNPATAPDAAPRVVACPSLIRSTMSQPSIAAAAARWVFMNATAAWLLAASADPALKPNQPNQRMPVPSNVNGSECGGMASPGQPRRFPRTITTASAATPALMWTTVPPAKSRAPRLNNQPVGLNTQCATGEYTSTIQTPRNTTQPANFIRSAVAPVINAGVITANIIW